uniref:DDE Tnp4 domain-containing protein n=1 Tax=Caenorhabditis japonica TaxID=281687 RepID=A0A8R1ETS5_CAEJA
MMEKKIRKKNTGQKKWKNSNLVYFKQYCQRITNCDKAVKEHVFVTKKVLLELVSCIRTKNHFGRRQKLSAVEKIIVFLQFVTGGESFGRLSRRIGVAKSTISEVVMCVARDINTNYNTIHFPATTDEWRKVEDSFRRRKLVSALGCLDGKHIRIRAPPSTGSLFYNYKHYFSFVLLALVDGDGRLLWIDIGAPGSTNDATIFGNSSLKEVLDDENKLPLPRYWNNETIMPSFILADGIFPLSKSLMKAFPGRGGLSPEEIHFNKTISHTRVRVEHVFGIISSKFRILRKEFEIPYRKSVDVTQALCKIHNGIIGPPPNGQEEVEEFAYSPYSDAKEQREALKDFFCR